MIVIVINVRFINVNLCSSVVLALVIFSRRMIKFIYNCLLISKFNSSLIDFNTKFYLLNLHSFDNFFINSKTLFSQFLNVVQKQMLEIQKIEFMISFLNNFKVNCHRKKLYKMLHILMSTINKDTKN